MIALTWGKGKVASKKEGYIQALNICPNEAYIYIREQMLIIDKLRKGEVEDLKTCFEQLQIPDRYSMYADLVLDLINSNFRKEIISSMQDEEKNPLILMFEACESDEENSVK